MVGRICTLAVAAMLVVGCAAPPTADLEYQDTVYNVQTASASMEADEPATLPIEEELSRPHTVDFYVQVALERNANILAAQRRVAAEAQVIPQATALDDPRLSETFSPFSTHSPQTASGRMPNTLTLAQKLPWFGTLRVRGEVAEQQAKIALTELAETELKVIEDVKLAYHDLAYNQRAIDITERGKGLLEQVIQSARSRQRTGGSLQDVLRAQRERDKLIVLLIDLDRGLRSSQADLAALLHTSPETRFKIADEEVKFSVPDEIDRLYDAAVRCRPELQKHFHAIVRDQRSEELAKLKYYPDVTLGVGWQAITSEDALSGVATGRDNALFTVGVNLPVWRDKLRAGVQEAEHRVVASARRYDSARDDTFRIIKRLMIRAQALERQILVFSDGPEGIVPRALRSLRLAMSGYRSGTVEFQEVIENWIDLLAFQVQLARLQSDLAQTMASLEHVVGCQLATLPESEPGPIPVPAP